MNNSGSFDFSQIFQNLGQVREQADQMRARLEKMRITGEAGAGMVKVTLNGEGRVQDVDIDPALLSPGEKDMLEELIVSAFADASDRVKAAVQHEMKGITGSLPIPGLDKLFGL